MIRRRHRRNKMLQKKHMVELIDVQTKLENADNRMSENKSKLVDHNHRKTYLKTNSDLHHRTQDQHIKSTYLWRSGRSYTDQDPSVLEVPRVNCTKYVVVKSVQYKKMGYAPGVIEKELND